MLLKLEKERRKVSTPAFTITLLLLLNLLAVVMTDQYAILWILSSLLFCVFSILFLVMPTTKRSAIQEPKEGKLNLDRANVMENKELLGLALWNGFFINSQPMARGIIAIFSFDILLIISLGVVGQVLTLEVTGLLLLQSMGMIVFYVGIIKIRPYDKQFLEEVQSIGRSVRDFLKGRPVRRFKGVFFTLLVLSVFVLSLITAMLLPGSSIKLLRGDSNVDLVKGAIPLALIFISQFLLVRQTQGISSRRMADDLLRRKLALLETRTAPEGTGVNGLEGQMPRYFKVIRHDIFGHLPVYLMNPDLAAILGEQVGPENVF